MNKYRKKPIVIEAEQWFPGTDVAGVNDDPVALLDYFDRTGSQNGLESAIGTLFDTSAEYALIDTLEGIYLVTKGDWIITGIQGEKYPCKPDIFEQTYEIVT